MPHPRRLVNPKIPRFSNIVRSDAPAIQSPLAHENVPDNSLPAPSQQPFNPRVAAYTFAFVTVLVGGIFVGAMSKEVMDNRKRRQEYERLSTEGKLADLRKLKSSLLEQRGKLEDQIALVRIQGENIERRNRRRN